MGLLIVNIIIAVASLIAAVCWMRSALIVVPDNIDTFIGQLQRIGYWNGWAAGAACVAASFTVVSVILGIVHG